MRLNFSCDLPLRRYLFAHRLADALLEHPDDYFLKPATRKQLDPTAEMGVCLTIVSRLKIRRLNRQNRGVNKVTDVLSFPMLEMNDGDFTVAPAIQDYEPSEQMLLPLGDIVICWQRVKAQAKAYGHSRERELAYLTIHGLLHLLGYDHLDENKKSVMRALEEKILEASGLALNQSKENVADE